MTNSNKVVPISLITGFLGSGKTTLINQILRELPELKISVILNEFGDAQLESQFITSRKDDVFELSNGCMCCVAQKDFEQVIRWILTERPQTEYILIEASGLSDPLPIATLLGESSIKDMIRLDTIACVVDGERFFESKDQYSTVMLQLANSDIVLVSKAVSAGEEAVKKISNFVSTIVPRLQVVPIVPEIPLELLIDTNTSHQFGQLKEQGHKHEHVQEFFWKADRPFTFFAFNALLQRLPSSIVRGKGVVFSVDAKGKEEKMLLQYVGSRAQYLPSGWLDGEEKRSALVFLGKDFDRVALERELKGCLVE